MDEISSLTKNHFCEVEMVPLAKGLFSALGERTGHTHEKRVEISNNSYSNSISAG